MISLSQGQGFDFRSVLNPEGSRLFPQFFTFPRHAGKPDLRWRAFDWKYTDISFQKTRYRLYFYSEEQWAAQFAAPLINDEIAELSKIFQYHPSQIFSYLLFSSQRDFQQANIFDITEGVQGITSTTERTMAIPYWGELDTFRHISTHEMVHQFQLEKLTDLAGPSTQVVLASIPLWFTEGLAEYYSLKGMDPETRVYLRDLLVYPDAKRDYVMPKFFEMGALDFIHVYKVGQAKIAFMEVLKEGTAQKVLTLMGQQRDSHQAIFQEIVSQVLGLSTDEIEKKWQTYLKSDYLAEANRLSQALDSFTIVPNTGDTLDSFAISPSGDLIAIREIDPITGVTSIQLLDQKNSYEKTEVVRDRLEDTLSLYFFQRPGFALSDHSIAYLAETVAGPQLVLMEINRDPKKNKINLGKPIRFKLFEHQLNQASTPTFSPDGQELSFVGTNAMGWQNIYVLSLLELNQSGTGKFQEITQGYYSWRTLDWGKDGILASSDQTADAKYNLFKVDPKMKAIERLTFSGSNQLSPTGDLSHYYFQSWETGVPQIHLKWGEKSIQLTDVKTQLSSPQFRKGDLYALGLKSGRFHLYKIDDAHLLRIQTSVHPDPLRPPWRPVLMDLPSSEIHSYRPFFSSGIRMDSISGVLGTGGIGGVSATGSDLMRNYSASADFVSLTGVGITQADFFFSSHVGRLKWTLGAYHLNQPTLDNVLSSQDHKIRTYFRREYGALSALQYPLGPFSYLDLELRIGGTHRSQYSDPTLAPAWEAKNPGGEPIVVPTVRYGWDSILYEPYTGPLKGPSILIEADTTYFAQRGTIAERLRWDSSYYIQIAKRSVLSLTGMFGASWGDPFSIPFLVSSDDILRGYVFGDSRLYGNYLLATKVEFTFPVGSIIGFQPLRGIAAYDLGSIFIHPREVTSNIASSTSGGIELNLFPLSFNFLLSFPIKTAPGPVNNPVFHFTLRYLYL